MATLVTSVRYPFYHFLSRIIYSSPLKGHRFPTSTNALTLDATGPSPTPLNNFPGQTPKTKSTHYHCRSFGNTSDTTTTKTPNRALQNTIDPPFPTNLQRNPNIRPNPTPILRKNAVQDHRSTQLRLRLGGEAPPLKSYPVHSPATWRRSSTGSVVVC